MRGFELPGELDRLLVISPHLDDAVISCGALLLAHPGATVATLFAASPAAYTDPLNEHDAACGFQPGDDTMAIRRAEDTRAVGRARRAAAVARLLPELARRGADPLAIPPGAVEALFAVLADVRPTTVVAPLGLAHVDHQACHATALALRAGDAHVPWLFYSDLPYAYFPRVLAARFRALHKAGIVATPACPAVAPDFDTKWRAFLEYATQQGPMDAPFRLRERLARAGESYWLLDGFE